MKFHAILSAVAILSTSVGASASAVSWNLANDYVGVFNPNGAWSYGSIGSAPGDAFSALAWNPGTSSYGIAAVNEVFVYQNSSPTTAFGIAPGQISLESDYGNAAVRWTAPSAGDYAFSVAIGGTTDSGPEGYGNNFATFGGVRVNGVDQLATAFVNNTGTWNFMVTLLGGQSVDAFVLNPGFANGGNTQALMSVSTVAEPASVALVLSALGVFGTLRLSKRKTAALA